MKHKILILLSLTILLVLTACEDKTSTPAFSTRNVEVNGLNNEDVYLIFTNPSPHTDAGTAPAVTFNETISESSRPSVLLNQSNSNTPENTITDPQLWKLPDGLRPEKGNLSHRGAFTGETSFTYY